MCSFENTNFCIDSTYSRGRIQLCATRAARTACDTVTSARTGATGTATSLTRT